MKLNSLSKAPILFCLLGLVACGQDNANKPSSPTEQTKEAEDIADEINKIVDEEVEIAAKDSEQKTPSEIRAAIASRVEELQKAKDISDREFLKGLLFLKQESLFTYLMRLQYLGEDRDFVLPRDEKVMSKLLADLVEISDPETGDLAEANRARGLRSLTAVQEEYQRYNEESRANFMAMRALGYEPTNGQWESSEKKNKNRKRVDELLKREKEIDHLLELNDQDFGRADKYENQIDPISLAEKRGQNTYRVLSAQFAKYKEEVAAKAAQDAERKKREEEELKRQQEELKHRLFPR